jgi:hypothetical protein
MIKQLLVCTGMILAISSPALADCAQEISQLDTKFKETEAQSGQPLASPHQAEALQVPQDQAGGANMPAAGSAPDSASSEHQREVLKGAGQQSDQEKFAAQLKEARQAAQNGDEAACMTKVGEVRKLLGIN